MLHQGQVLQLWGCVGPHRGAGHNRDVCDPYLLSRTFGVCPGSATSLQAACLCHCVPPRSWRCHAQHAPGRKRASPPLFSSLPRQYPLLGRIFLGKDLVLSAFCSSISQKQTNEKNKQQTDHKTHQLHNGCLKLTNFTHYASISLLLGKDQITNNEGAYLESSLVGIFKYLNQA